MQLLFMAICDWNFGEKDSVTSCAPTNSPSLIRTLGQPLIFGFKTIRTIGTCIQLATSKSTNFLWTFEKVGQLRFHEKNKLQRAILHATLFF